MTRQPRFVLLAVLAAFACKGDDKSAGKPAPAPGSAAASAAPRPPRPIDASVHAGAVDAGPPAPPPVELVGVWSPYPEVVDGRFHEVEILRADGSFEWRETELRCDADVVRVAGKWRWDADRLVIESETVTAWEGKRKGEGGKCKHDGQELVVSPQVELSREPVTACPAEIEYPAPGGGMARAKVADLKFPCVMHGMDYKFKVATVEAYDPEHPAPQPPAPPAPPAK